MLETVGVNRFDVTIGWTGPSVLDSVGENRVSVGIKFVWTAGISEHNQCWNQLVWIESVL